MFTLPATLTLGGEIQKILFFFNLEMANTVPAVMAAGRAGGTEIVIKFRHLSTISQSPYPYSSISLKVAANPTNAIIPIPKTNLRES
jgi:hypothetical protein